MTEERKKELLPYFAYKESQKLNPDKYGKASIEEWQSLIQESPEDVEKIVQAAEQMSEEGWSTIEEEYKEQTESAVQFAAKGAKLQKLKSMKKSKKCKCGCDMVSVKAAGGKMIDRCACGCSTKKHEKGGSVQKKQEGGEVKNPVGTVAKKGEKIDRISKAQAGKSIKKKPIPKDPGNGETWKTDNPYVGTGNNSMNPKDWDKNKTKPKTETKKIVPKKAKGGLIEKFGSGGVSKINEVRKAQQDARKNSKPTTTNFVMGAERINTPISTTKTPTSSNFKQVKENVERLQKNPYAIGHTQPSTFPTKINENRYIPRGTKGMEEYKKFKTSQPVASIEIGKLSAPEVLPESTPNTQISIVDYLVSKGMAFDKASRAKLAKQYGIENYDFSAKSNNELLNILKNTETRMGEFAKSKQNIASPIATKTTYAKCGGKVKKTAPDRVKKAKLKK